MIRSLSQTSPNNEKLDAVAARHGFSPAAAHAFWDALVAGAGGMAQFHHPEFGGSGQWIRGGMLMVGDMFNHALAARVRGLADDLAELYEASPPAEKASPLEAGSAARWWPDGLTSPSTLGAQNGVRYAYFPAEGRLAIEREGELELYDTGEHAISGVSQQQGGARGTLEFTSQQGPVSLSALRRMQSGDAPSTEATTGPASDAGEILDIIEKLSMLCERGVLSEAEYSAKKLELLSRL
jgi:hypothetical protein